MVDCINKISLGVDIILGVNKLLSEPGVLLISHSLVGLFADKTRTHIKGNTAYHCLIIHTYIALGRT